MRRVGLINMVNTAYAETKFIQRLAQVGLVSVGGATPRFKRLQTCASLHWSLQCAVFARAQVLKIASNANELAQMKGRDFTDKTVIHVTLRSLVLSAE